MLTEKLTAINESHELNPIYDPRQTENALNKTLVLGCSIVLAINFAVFSWVYYMRN